MDKTKIFMIVFGTIIFSSCIFMDNVGVSRPSFKCFVAGTKITMSDGSTKSIEEIKPGDAILNTNIIMQYEIKIETDTVLAVESPIHDDIVKLVFSDSTSNSNTFDHPYYVKGKRWCSYAPQKTWLNYGIMTDQLSMDDTCYKYSSNKLIEVTIVDIQENIGEIKTYNISALKKNGNYFANGILVNNEEIPQEISYWKQYAPQYQRNYEQMHGYSGLEIMGPPMRCKQSQIYYTDKDSLPLLADFKKWYDFIQFKFLTKDSVKIDATIARLISLPVETLDFSSLDFRKLPESVKKLKTLRAVILSNNPNLDIEQALSELSYLPKLRAIELSFNSIVRLPENILGIKRLEFLVLDHNPDIKLESLFQQLSFLKYFNHLNLCGNTITMLPDNICLLKNLTGLWLVNNNLEQLPMCFYKLNKMASLNLGNNKFKEIPNSVFILPRLRHFYAGCNQLSFSSIQKARLLKLMDDDFCCNDITEYQRGSSYSGCKPSLINFQSPDCKKRCGEWMK